MDSKHLDKIECKIDAISERISSIDVTLASQHVSLKEHMRRTAILEQEVAPIKTSMERVAGVIKLIFILAAIGAFAEGLVTLLSYLGIKG